MSIGASLSSPTHVKFFLIPNCLILGIWLVVPMNVRTDAFFFWQKGFRKAGDLDDFGLFQGFL